MTDSYSLGAVVPLTFEVTDAAGDLADTTSVALTITKPDGTTVTPTVDHPETGVYLYDYATTMAGRHTARFVASGVNAGAIDDIFDVVATNLAYVTVADVTDYLNDSDSWDSMTVSRALAAEQAAQARACRLDPYTADLREALLRRVQRNLAMRPLPLAVLQGDAEAGSTVLTGSDPEVRRLERPYRKLAVG